jgi:hypothetical protein
MNVEFKIIFVRLNFRITVRLYVFTLYTSVAKFSLTCKAINTPEFFYHRGAQSLNGGE